MAATEWAVVSEDKFIGAYVSTGLLDAWFLNPFYPIAETPLSKWLMEQVGYQKPVPPSPGPARPEYGQGWPVWSNAPVQISGDGFTELQIVYMTQAAYEALPVKDKHTMYVLEG